ncbi:MAG: nucleotide-binding universal stress UspA family protein [Patiriisocius sp.]
MCPIYNISENTLLNQKKFHTIGIGVTFSPNLKANIYEGARLALLFKARLVLIHVGEASIEKKEKFESCLAHFLTDGLIVSIVFKPGEPVSAILESVKENNIDLLILGALQRENFLKYYIGSIARKITRQATCSVMLLINPSIERVHCKHVVVNGLEDPRTPVTISAAFFVATALESEKITIVEEVSHTEVGTVEDDKSLRKTKLLKEKISRREDSRIQKILEEIPEKYKDKKLIATQPIFGKRGYSIGHYAEVVRADLLVMNAPKASGFWDRLFPHDIEHILTELPTDILIVQ